MAFIEKFLGKRVEIPEDRRYHAKQGLWAKSDGQQIVFGLSEPALVLMGGLNDVDWLINQGDTVEKGEAVLFAITGKILYLDAPVGGDIHFNPEVKHDSTLVLKDPYNRGWLFKIIPNEDAKQELKILADGPEYVESLKTSEGAKNPEGLKGGVSGICKAVYTGIREQKLC